jgi:hypothetical protein
VKTLRRRPYLLSPSLLGVHITSSERDNVESTRSEGVGDVIDSIADRRRLEGWNPTSNKFRGEQLWTARLSLCLRISARWTRDSGTPLVSRSLVIPISTRLTCGSGSSPHCITDATSTTLDLKDSPSGHLLWANRQRADMIGPLSSRPTPHRQQSILDGRRIFPTTLCNYASGFRHPTVERKSDLGWVLLSKLDGERRELQKQRGQMWVINICPA